MLHMDHQQSDLVLGDLAGVHNAADLAAAHDQNPVAELHQHTQLAVRLEAGKNSGGVVVVK